MSDVKNVLKTKDDYGDEILRLRGEKHELIEEVDALKDENDRLRAELASARNLIVILEQGIPKD